MRSGINSTRQATDYGNPCIGQLVSQLFGAFSGVVGRLARSDDADRVRVTQFSPDIEDDGRIMNLS